MRALCIITIPILFYARLHAQRYYSPIPTSFNTHERVINLHLSLAATESDSIEILKADAALRIQNGRIYCITGGVALATATAMIIGASLSPIKTPLYYGGVAFAVIGVGFNLGGAANLVKGKRTLACLKEL